MALLADDYASPEIVYAGDLELQAGSPLSFREIDFADFAW